MLLSTAVIRLVNPRYTRINVIDSDWFFNKQTEIICLKLIIIVTTDEKKCWEGGKTSTLTN